jgi:hypothetical protein
MQGQSIHFYSNNVTLEIYLNDSLEPNGPMQSYLEVDDGLFDTKSKCWDNMRFFLEAPKDVIKEECRSDVEELGLNIDDVYEDVVYLIKKANKLGYL